MIEYKMGTVEANDQDFGNTYSIDMRGIDGEWTSETGARPKNYHGVHALVQTGEDEYNFMCEDDGHFRTHTILNRSLLKELLSELRKIQDGVILKPNWKYSLTNKFVSHRSHRHFPSSVTIRNTSTPLVEIDIPGIGKRKESERTEVAFDISWIADLIRVIDIKNWKER